MAGQNTSTIDVLIKSQLDTSRAIADLKRLTEEAKNQASLIGKALELSFSKKGSLKSSIFIDMVSAIKQVESAVKSLPQAMSKTFSSLEQSATRSKNAVDEVSKSMDKVASKKTKARVDVEVTQTVNGKQQPIGSTTSAMGVLGKSRISKSGEHLYSEFQDTQAEIRQRALSAKESRKYRQQIEKLEAADRQRVTPLSAHQYAMDLMARQRAERITPSPKTYTSKDVTMLPQGYLDKNFGTGGQVVPNIQAYGKFLVEQMGMSVKQAMNKVRPLIQKEIPGTGGNAGFNTFGLNLSEQQKTLEATSAYLNKIAGGTSRLNEYGNKMTWINDIMRKQGDAVLRLGRYYISFFAITSTIQQFTEAMRQAVAMQDQMLELKKFLPEGSNIGGLRQSAYGMAAEFGVPIDTVLGSYAEFAKQGKAANEIIDMTRSALLGVNVASTDFATTVTYLTTATNVWKDQFSDTTVLIDKLALVQAKSSASSEVLISAMQRSGSMAKTMGVSLDQLFGYIAAVSEKTQLSGEVIGTSLKTIIERAQRMKTLNLLQGMEEFKGQQFVSPISGDIMGAPQILETVAKKWSILTDVQKKFIGEQMAGSRQLNAFIALMENMGRAAELTSGSINSLGYAQKANASEMEKFSKSFQRFSTLMYEMSTAVLLPLIGQVTNLVNAFSSLASMAPGLSAGIAGAATGFLAFSGAISLFSTFRKEIGHAMNAVMVFFLTMGKAKTVGSGFVQALGNTGMWAGVARNWTIMSSGLSMIAVSGTRAAGTMRALWGAMNLAMGPIGLAIAAAAMAWSSYSSMTESAAEKQKEMNDKLAEAIKLFKELSAAKSEDQRLEISRSIAKGLGASGMAGMKMERDPLSGALIPAYSKTSDLQYNKEIMATKNAGISGLPDATANIVDLGNVFKEADTKLKRFVGKTIEDEKEVIRTLQLIRGLMATNPDVEWAVLERINEIEASKKKYTGRAQDKDVTDALGKLDDEELIRLRNIQAAMSGKTEKGRLSKDFFKSIGKIPNSAFTQLLGSDDTSSKITNIMASSQVLQPEVTKNKNEELQAEAMLRVKNLEYAREMAKIEVEMRQKRMTTKTTSADDYLAQYAYAQEQILKYQSEEEEARRKINLAIKENNNDNKIAAESAQTDAKEMIATWKQYSNEITGASDSIRENNAKINALSESIRGQLDGAISSATKGVDTLSAHLLDLTSRSFTIKVAVEAFLRSMLPGWLSKMLFGELPTQSPAQAAQSNFEAWTKRLKEAKTPAEKAEISKMAQESYAQDFKAVKGSKVVGPGDAKGIADQIQYAKNQKALEYKEPSGGAAKRDRESTAHYNALERIKKAEADLQKQQQMSSYWEGKMPDKYLLKYDAETAKYESEMQAKKAALASEEKNLKPDEVKKFKEEIAVLQEKINLQSKYRKQAEEIAAFEKWESDNRVGMERLRTELSIKSEIYDMEYAALYSASRSDEKSYMEWKIKSALVELEAQRMIAIETQKIVAMQNGKNEAEALSIAMSTEEVQLLDLKINKEEQMLGLIDRQLDLKKKQRINEQVREVQGMLSTGIFDALSMKNKNERKKQLAEIAKELSKLGEDSNTAAYGIAQAESTGNIDAINSSRDKWNEVNRQIEEARKKMDEVNNSTNKWKEVLENIGDSVLKKLADKFAEMLINKTGLGDMFGMIFGGIDGMGGGGKKSNAPALSDPRSALGALAMGGLGMGKRAMSVTDMIMPGISNSSVQYNINAAGGAGGAGGGLMSMLGGFGGGSSKLLPANYSAAARNGYTGRGVDQMSSAKKYGTSQYLTSAMLGYAIGSSTSNRTVGVLGGAAAGFLTGGPIGAILGAIGGLLGRKKNGDEAPPVQPVREMYPLFRNVDALDRNTNALMKLSDGIFNAPSTFEVNKVQAERNGTTINNNITINAAGGNAKSIAAEVNAVISNSYQSSLGKMATSTSNWG